MHVEPMVFLVEDDDTVRLTLSRMLKARALDYHAYASAQEFLETLDSLDTDGPCCLVTDLRMPGMDGIALQRTLHERGCYFPVIVITGYGDVPHAVSAMKGGAVDFIEKPFREQVLIDAIAKALAQSEADRQNRVEVQEARARLATLTPREIQVMEMVVAGKANKVIAADLDLSIKTIEFHRAHVMEKMTVESVAELVRIVMAARSNGSSPGIGDVAAE